MKVLVATKDSGSLKEVVFSSSTDTSKADSERPEIKTLLADKKDPFERIALSKYGYILARRSGHIGLYNVENYELIRKLGDFRELVGLIEAYDRVIAITTGGNGAIFDLKNEKAKPIPVQFRDGLTVAVAHPLKKDIILTSGAYRLPEVVKLDLKSGEEEVLWTGKNPKNNRLDLKEENYVENAAFLETKTDYNFVTVTSDGKLRVYNTTHGGRPVQQTQVSAYSVKAVAAPHGSSVVVGDTQSKLGLYKTLPKVELLGHYKGVAGSTSHISVHGKYLAAGGLDRYLRVFEVVSRAPAGKVYIGEEIDFVLVLEDDEAKRKAELDDMWNSLDYVPKKLRAAEEGVSDGESSDSDAFDFDPVDPDASNGAEPAEPAKPAAKPAKGKAKK